MSCENLKEPPECDGYIYFPAAYDTKTLISLYLESCLEIDGDMVISYEEAKKLITKLIDKNDWDYRNNLNNIYCWKNKNNEIVCIVLYSSVDNFAKISNVYSPFIDKGKGYEDNLIYNVTQAILEDGMIPVVYLEMNNMFTLDFYKNVGYQVCGNLVNFTYSNSKVRRK